ncbi:uncharacterized protein PRCAT00003530001 [Priceomyces carsonii]|uniref:uncharacterized protein n=1 Tax=Priceomyces carsonii TaxID=28549 RepID=UPI002ED8AFBB|nr:unnamed protein product [Priceomyces carsonii]
MYLGCLEDIHKTAYQNYDKDRNRFHCNNLASAHVDVFGENQVLLNDGTNFFNTTADYFLVCLSSTRYIIEKVKRGNRPASEAEAAEIFFFKCFNVFYLDISSIKTCSGTFL